MGRNTFGIAYGWLLLLLHCTSHLLSVKSHSINIDDILKERKMLLSRDRAFMMGQNQVLTVNEEMVNEVLMEAKARETMEGFQSCSFLPARNFITVRKDIEASNVFKIIKRMPKGAALHLHSTVVTSLTWVVEKLTYWPHLYMCYTHNDLLLLQFFQRPDSTCDWRLVKEVRESFPASEQFDAYILTKISLFQSEHDEKHEDEEKIWEAFEQSLKVIRNMLRYRPAWEAYLYRALQEFMHDNVLYMELRTTLPRLYELDGTQLTAEESMRVSGATVQHFLQDHPHQFYGTRFIYAPNRQADNKTVEGHVDLVKQLKAQFPDLVAGFDLVGHEDKGPPLREFLEPLLRLSDANIPVFYHSGETVWMGMSTDDNLVDALLLNATRLGHAFALNKHPVIKRIAKAKNIAVEVCPISNQGFGLVRDLRNHPAAVLAAEGFPIVVAPDGSTSFGAMGLSYDFYEAFMALGGLKADLRFLKQLAINSIKYSSLDDKEKSALLLKWTAKWEEFITSEISQDNVQSVLPTITYTISIIIFVNCLVLLYKYCA